MANKLVFINLPVKDLPKSREFFVALGYHFNENFSDETGACLVISETIHAMLLTHDKFLSFTPKGNGLVDANKSTEVLNALSCESREEVDTLVAKAVAAGGRTYNEPRDHGFMYGHEFQDLDGHIWELFWMDLAAIPQG